MRSMFLPFTLGLFILLSVEGLGLSDQRSPTFFCHLKTHFVKSETCLRETDKAMRKSCFKTLGAGIRLRELQQCQSEIRALSAETQDEELLRYPKQGSALAELENARAQAPFGRMLVSYMDLDRDCESLIIRTRVEINRCHLAAVEVQPACLARMQSSLAKEGRTLGCERQVSQVFGNSAQL